MFKLFCPYILNVSFDNFTKLTLAKFPTPYYLPTSVICVYVSVDRNDCDGGLPVGTLAQIFSFAMFWLGVLDRRVSWYW